MQQTKTSTGEIASSYVALGVPGYNFEKPIQWASGTFNPFYVDNRRAISDTPLRKSIRKALASLIKSPDTIDYVYPIPKAGIAPATLLALEINKPMLIQHGGVYYSINIHIVREFMRRGLTPLMKSADVIAGTAPFGIIFGIAAAEELDRPFLFVREKPKEHGLMKQIEGIIDEKNVYVALIDPTYADMESYKLDALHALRDLKMEVLAIFDYPIGPFFKEVDIKGKRIATVEDLVSTGESLINQITGLINMGATIDPCSVFSYELPSAVENFKKHGLVNKSVINFLDLMEEYGKTISPGDEKKVWEWYYNQPNWGNLNGFPAVKK
jgi:orotate phosphoribosyltransferase